MSKENILEVKESEVFKDLIIEIKIIIRTTMT